MALSVADRLEALYGLTPDALGLEEAAFTRRVALWEQVAAESSDDPTVQAAHVQALALRNWQTVLMEEDEKFRAEGDITSEKNVMARVAQVGVWLTAAERRAGLDSESGAQAVSFAPLIEAWGLEG